MMRGVLVGTTVRRGSVRCRNGGALMRYGRRGVVALAVSLAVLGVLASVAAASPNTAYVANFGGNSVTPINTLTNMPGAEIKAESGPYAVAITPDAKTAYVALASDNLLLPINLATNEAGSAFAGWDMPHSIAIAPNGITGYVPNNSFPATLTAFEVATNKKTTETTFGNERVPYGIAITPSGATAYIASEKFGGAGVVTPIELATLKVGGEITVGSKPRGIAITPSGTTAYVTNEASNSVTPIELATNKAGAEIKVGSKPFAIAITPNGSTAYVTNSGGKSVTPIELAMNKAGTEIAVGSEPEGIAITPSGTTAYVTNHGSNSVTPIELAMNKPGTEIKVGKEPVGIAIPPLQPGPHWTSGGASIANGIKTPVVTFGGATNLGEKGGLGETNCKGVGGGFVENLGGRGTGKTLASAFYECKAPACEAEIKAKFGVAGRGEVRTENLPQPTKEKTLGGEGWSNELFEGASATGGEKTLRERIGTTWTGFPSGGQVGHASPEGMIRTTISCSIPSLKTVASEAIYEGALEPEVGEAFNGAFNGLSAAKPSEAHFAGMATGSLHSEAGGEIFYEGNVKYLGYNSQAVIGVSK
jgi:YVTN family beta-propeller protein